MKKPILIIGGMFAAMLLSLQLTSAQGIFAKQFGPGTIDVTGASYANEEGQKNSYVAALMNNTPVATPTDVAVLTGATGKIVKVTRVKLTIAASALGQIDVALVKRTGGTQSAVNTAFAAGNTGSMDSTDAASAVLAAGLSGVYTANPASSGTAVANAAVWTVQTVASGMVVLQYDCPRSQKCITLRGPTQIITVNLNGDTLLTGEKFGIEFNWTEE